MVPAVQMQPWSLAFPLHRPKSLMAPPLATRPGEQSGSVAPAEMKGSQATYGDEKGAGLLDDGED